MGEGTIINIENVTVSARALMRMTEAQNRAVAAMCQRYGYGHSIRVGTAFDLPATFVDFTVELAGKVVLYGGIDSGGTVST